MALLCDLSQGFTSLDHVDIPGAREGTLSRIARLSETNPGRSGGRRIILLPSLAFLFHIFKGRESLGGGINHETA